MNQISNMNYSQMINYFSGIMVKVVASHQDLEENLKTIQDLCHEIKFLTEYYKIDLTYMGLYDQSASTFLEIYKTVYEHVLEKIKNGKID